MKTAVLVALAVFTIGYLIVWFAAGRTSSGASGAAESQGSGRTTPAQLAIGFVTNFFDTLGIGSFATTSSLFKLFKVVPDGLIPGTLNVGHTLPTVVEACIFISIITVDPLTLACLIAASVAGAWIGAGIVSKWPQHKVRIGLGLCLIAAAGLMLASQLNLFPIGSDAVGLTGARLAVGTIGNFILGALMTLGIGLYAPCMILVSLLGMSPKVAFPIMMGSCAFLMPVGSVQFLRTKRYQRDASIGLALGGIPAVFLAAFLVKSLPLSAIRWLVVVVVLYTAAMMLRSAYLDRNAAPAPQPDA
ncbi:MAG: sulfite exporter TauE/SafE family protein [Candidatus Acidiferrales bacterium]|jgi:uncharacterized membrane protein YfcA